MDNTSGIQVSIREDPGCCPVCHGPWYVQKTVSRQGKTIVHGQFEVRETVHVCATRCRHKTGVLVTRRAASLAEHLIPGRGVGYDVMVWVGLRRFVEHCQREEIRTVLVREHGIRLSSGEISALAKLFLDYLQQLHNERSLALRAALVSDGGWPLHLDATGEDGRGTLFVVSAGWRNWVLGAWKLSTERAELILPCLRQVVERFGPPCAVMRDLGGPVTLAVNELLAELKLDVPVLACHQHFLSDIGRDLLKSAHGQLRDLFRRMKVRPKLRAVVRELGRKLGENIEQARQQVQIWQEQTGTTPNLPRGQAGMATVRALTQWILDYSTDGSGYDFPYDRPYLDLYDRCMTGAGAVDTFLSEPDNDSKVQNLLKRVRNILAPLVGSIPFRRISRQLRARGKLFDELRDALRLVPKALPATDKSISGQSPATKQAAAELRDIQKEIDNLVTSLKRRRTKNATIKDICDAIKLILRHIEDHGPYLWGHVIPIPADKGGGIRLVHRTNNLMENFFKGMKHDERRRSGRKILTQDFEHLPAQATLAYNLNYPDYVEILCGSLKLLPNAFAKLDAEKRRRKLAGEEIDNDSSKVMIPQITTASLPIEDRRLIRANHMHRRVVAAAKFPAHPTSRSGNHHPPTQP